MTDDIERGLLAAVLAAPDDDTPRLVLADYWDETGRPERAEFVRVQCELAKWGCVRGDGSWLHYCRPRPQRGEFPCHALRRRERELFTFDNIQRWFREPGPVFDRHTNNPTEFDQLLEVSRRTGITAALVERGWVGRWAGPLATLFGGPCRYCINWARVGQVGDNRSHGHPNCPVCKGDRDYRTPGVAAQLFGSQPVTGVVISGRGARHGRTWYREDYRGVADPQLTLPAALFDLLPYAEHQGGYGCQTTWKEYLSITPGSALSIAAVALGRSLAEGQTHEVECERCRFGGSRSERHGMKHSRADCPGCGGKGTVRKPGLAPLLTRTGDRR